MKREITVAAFAIAAALTTLADAAAAQTGPSPGQRVAIVTGSTSGLGRELAKRLADDGYHVVVHGRNVERGAQVVGEIEGAGGSARFYRADFAAFDEVRALADEILSEYDRIDLLINNAGFGSAPNERMVSEDGLEFRFQVNYLAPFLLTHELLPTIVASAPARIVNVSSLAQSPIDWDDVMIEHDFSGGRAYGQSKLAQVAHTIDLNAEVGDEGVVVNALHPATYMPTGMVRRAGVTPRSTIDEGADAVMQLVESDEIGGGGFFRGLEPAEAHDQVYDAAHRARLRRLAEELTGIR